MTLWYAGYLNNLNKNSRHLKLTTKEILKKSKGINNSYQHQQLISASWPRATRCSRPDFWKSSHLPADTLIYVRELSWAAFSLAGFMFTKSVGKLLPYYHCITDCPWILVSITINWLCAITDISDIRHRSMHKAGQPVTSQCILQSWDGLQCKQKWFDFSLYWDYIVCWSLTGQSKHWTLRTLQHYTATSISLLSPHISTVRPQWTHHKLVQQEVWPSQLFAVFDSWKWSALHRDMVPYYSS